MYKTSLQNLSPTKSIKNQKLKKTIPMSNENKITKKYTQKKKKSIKQYNMNCILTKTVLRICSLPWDHQNSFDT